MPRKPKAAEVKQGKDNRGESKVARVHEPATPTRAGNPNPIPVSPPSLKGDRQAQRRFRDLYDAAPWLSESDRDLVGDLVLVRYLIEAQTADLFDKGLTTGGDDDDPTARRYLAPEFRAVMDMLEHVRKLSEALALDPSSRSRLGFQQARASSLLETIRDRRLTEAANAALDGDLVLDDD